MDIDTSLTSFGYKTDDLRVLLFHDEWRSDFVKYFDTHCMSDVRQQLTKGVDQISTNYVDHH